MRISDKTECELPVNVESDERVGEEEVKVEVEVESVLKLVRRVEDTEVKRREEEEGEEAGGGKLEMNWVDVIIVLVEGED